MRISLKLPPLIFLRERRLVILFLSKLRKQLLKEISLIKGHLISALASILLMSLSSELKKNYKTKALKDEENR